MLKLRAAVGMNLDYFYNEDIVSWVGQIRKDKDFEQ
jgi:hypothetical protein